MGMKSALAVKQVVGNTSPSLKADAGESFLVKDIMVYNPSGTHATIRIDKTTVGYFRVASTLGNNLPFPHDLAKPSFGFNVDAATVSSVEYNAINDAGGNALDQCFAAETDVASAADVLRMTVPEQIKRPPMTILGLLGQLGLFAGFPIAEGEEMIIEGVHQAGSFLMILYEIHDAGDMTPDMPNGSRSKEYLFLQYGNTGASINASADNLFDTPVSPAEFPAFPFGQVCPANTEIDILGVLASCYCATGATATNQTYTSYLKFLKGREVLWDEDRNGLLLYSHILPAIASLDLVGEGISLMGSYSDIDPRPPFIFPELLTFRSGDELNIYLTTIKANSGENIVVADQEIALINRVRRLD